MRKIIMVIAVMGILLTAPVLLAGLSSADSTPIDDPAALEDITVATRYSWANVQNGASQYGAFIDTWLVFDKGSPQEAAFLRDVVMKNKTDYSDYNSYLGRTTKKEISAYKLIQGPRVHSMKCPVVTFNEKGKSSSSNVSKTVNYPVGEQYFFHVEKGKVFSISIKFNQTKYSASIIGERFGEIELSSGMKYSTTAEYSEDMLLYITPNTGTADPDRLFADISVSLEGAYRPYSDASTVWCRSF